MLLLQDTPGRTCLIDNKEYLFFSGYSYLGMNHVKKFCDLLKEAIDKKGILFPTSRISNTRLKLYDEFENKLSELTGMEDTVCFSSGYLAGKTIAEILSDHQNVFVAPGAHPAIAIKTMQTLSAQNFNEWKETVVVKINGSSQKEFVLVSDSINILQGMVHDFSFVKNIKSEKQIIFLIDDSHGIGLTGNNGDGIISHLPQAKNTEYIICYSLSKAFNIQGGAISSSKYRSDKLREHPNYSGSTAISPAMIYAFLNSETLYATQREKLCNNISYLKRACKNISAFQNYHDLPIFICQKPGAEKIFFNNKIIISSFAYPYPSSPKTDRVIISALHTKEDIKKLCAASLT